MNVKFTTVSTEESKNLKDYKITYGFAQSKFGECILGINDDSQICYMAFYDEGKDNSAIDNLKKEWPNAILKENSGSVKVLAEKVFGGQDSAVDVLLKGTDFQVNVWKELTKLKPGATASYEQIAKAVGKPSAVRAVASAVARNRIAYVVPCHRVIQKTGNISKYRWGADRKKSILEFEKKLD